MAGLHDETRAFAARKRHEGAEARQAAAFFLVCGVDLDDALAAPPREKERLGLRLARLVERERLRGLRRHWSYDLNRHIALMQALKRLSATESRQGNGC